MHYTVFLIRIWFIWAGKFMAGNFYYNCNICNTNCMEPLLVKVLPIRATGMVVANIDIWKKTADEESQSFFFRFPIKKNGNKISLIQHGKITEIKTIRNAPIK